MAVSAEVDDYRWDDLLILCAANNFDGIKLADQSMAECLAAQRPVLYVDPPMSLVNAPKGAAQSQLREGPNLRVQAPGLARFTPIVQPFPARWGMARITTTICRRLLGQASARLGGKVAAVISAWPMHPILGSSGENVRIYWAQDDFVGGAALLGMSSGALAAAESHSAAAADLIVASSPSVARYWRDQGYTPVLIPFGADVGAYASVDAVPRPADVTLPGPIAGFVGHINARIELELLEAIAARNISLLLVGPRDLKVEPSRWAALLRRPNVQWVGPKPFNELPAYFGAIDVGLVPYGLSAFNIGSFPLKTLEYLAAGRPVVSTGLPASYWLNTELISIAGTPELFADAVLGWLQRPRGAADMAERRHFASRHDWSVRASDMLSAIENAGQRVAVAPVGEQELAAPTGP